MSKKKFKLAIRANIVVALFNIFLCLVQLILLDNSNGAMLNLKCGSVSILIVIILGIYSNRIKA